jgi:CheY-like chemotaxis protein
MRVLIVDDDLALLNAIRINLLSSGYEVATAANGHQALSEIESAIETTKPFQLMVTDLIMPGMSGLDLILAARKILPNLPVILVTAYSLHPIQEALKDLGSSAYLDKPFSSNKLLDAIRALNAYRS